MFVELVSVESREWFVAPKKTDPPKTVYLIPTDPYNAVVPLEEGVLGKPVKGDFFANTLYPSTGFHGPVPSLMASMMKHQYAHPYYSNAFHPPFTPYHPPPGAFPPPGGYGAKPFAKPPPYHPTNFGYGGQSGPGYYPRYRQISHEESKRDFVKFVEFA
eukprot:CAMPEP_0167745610 /NCGR_PEP_ID=MMETSP0110_2-20121227/3243_1 /TAXON_ID=629695 /ORGANISM="Gymnochlora sp., Strain CCMP2014" /LENGTH=158 /DNA_ID=CAMNT_0007630263 /DNA_START=121 /DNA_END=597 /DNA_ORIENTATION=-